LPARFEHMKHTITCEPRRSATTKQTMQQILFEHDLHTALRLVCRCASGFSCVIALHGDAMLRYRNAHRHETLACCTHTTHNLMFFSCACFPACFPMVWPLRPQSHLISCSFLLHHIVLRDQQACAQHHTYTRVMSESVFGAVASRLRQLFVFSLVCAMLSARGGC
jgi:hypothetical protein